MPTNLPDQNWTIPAGTDLADNPLAFNDFAADVLATVVLRYPNTATRDAFNGSRVAGDVSFTTGSTWYDRWTGTKWIPVSPIQASKTASQIVTNSTVLVNDLHLFVPIPAVVANWSIEGHLNYSTTAVADFKATFAANAGISSLLFGLSGLAVGSVAVTGDTNWDAQVPGTAIPIGGVGGTISSVLTGGFISTGVAGTLQLQWAQNTIEATNTQITTRSWLRITAIS